ncbi:hypothetical protein C2G38_2217996 [Gigaspora rosea]|uniref:Uncharacterized protein n=1 Tax=Gigaspora rosea TaxID=44941 RepID=A0A397U770_9GLOM|nr:hypothetical protein C2G38_2217996 [Gigaspora rosea]
MSRLTGSCNITICDTLCSNCYNGIAVNSSFEFKQHSEKSRSALENFMYRY